MQIEEKSGAGELPPTFVVKFGSWQRLVLYPLSRGLPFTPPCPKSIIVRGKKVLRFCSYRDG